VADLPGDDGGEAPEEGEESGVTTSAEHEALAAEVLRALGENGLPGAVEAAAGGPDRATTAAAVAFVLPPDWREAAQPMIDQLDQGGLATLLGVLAACWDAGYNQGGADLAAELVRRQAATQQGG
jgi:hypothetical protein